MGAGKVTVSMDDGIATITLSRPEVRNALDTGTVSELQEVLRELAASEEVRVALLTGAGPVFCAGADLKQRTTMTSQEVARHTDGVMECTKLIAGLPVPVIAVIMGGAYAGGLELALACDIRVVASDASFSLPEITLGIFPGAGAPLRLPPLVGKGWTKMLVLTGERIDAETAHRIGMVEVIAPPAELMPEATRLARRIADANPVAVRSAKRLIDSAVEIPMSAAELLSAALRHPLNDAADWSEGLRGARQRRGVGG
jgi:enoyl-CoA hydratase/carnithine racemase